MRDITAPILWGAPAEVPIRLPPSQPEAAAIIRYLLELGGGSCLGLGQFAHGRVAERCP